MTSFTLFGTLPVEIQDQIWQDAAVAAHNGPRVLHLGLFDVDSDDDDKDMLLLVPEASTVKETRQIRALSSACHQSRRWARTYLPDTLYLRPGELWFRDGEDIISFIGAGDGLELMYCFPRFRDDRWVPMISLHRLTLHSPDDLPAQDLSVRRLGINMNDHIRRGLTTIQQQGLADLEYDALCDRVLRHAIMAFYALKRMYPTAEIYAVWEKEDVPGFCPNAEAVSTLQDLRVHYNRTVDRTFSNWPYMQRVGVRRVDRLRLLAQKFLELEVGSAVFSGNEGTEDTRIVGIQRPTAARA